MPRVCYFWDYFGLCINFTAKEFFSVVKLSIYQQRHYFGQFLKHFEYKLIAGFIDFNFASKNAVNDSSVSQDKWNTYTHDDQKNL